MSGRKQALLVVAIMVIAGLGWLRVSPGAAERLKSVGVSPALVAMLAGDSSADRSAGQSGRPGGGRPGGGREVLVVTAPVSTGRINDRVNAIGDGLARRSVTVVPLSSGIITKVNVASGDRVEAGAVIAELDSDAEKIARDRAALAQQMAEEKLDRYQRLVDSRTVSTVQLNETRNELDNARLALREAELTLQRRRIVAPIAGIIGIVPIESGDYVTTQTEIATLDDRSQIMVDFWVPERFAGAIEPGAPVGAVAIAMPGKQFSGTVEAVGSRIDPDSRTLQVRARFDNARDDLRPGMSFRVTMRFPGERFPAVNPLAIQWSSDGAFVWKAREGVAVKTPVRIVQRNSDWVLVDGELVDGDPLVIEGVQTLREGARLKVADDGRVRPRPAGS